jgi:hypothetical protein
MRWCRFPRTPRTWRTAVKAAASHAAVVTMESDMADSGRRRASRWTTPRWARRWARPPQRRAGGRRAVLVDSAPGSAGYPAADRGRPGAGGGGPSCFCAPSPRTQPGGDPDRHPQARRPDAVVAFEPSALEQAAQLAQGQRSRRWSTVPGHRHHRLLSGAQQLSPSAPPK